MSRLPWFFAFSAFIACVAHAQADSPFYGTWAVSWEGQKQVYEAKLVLSSAGGSWKTSTQARNNPCVGREVPVKINSASADEAHLILAFSEVIQGCKDAKVVLKTTSGGITGTRGEAQLTLKRE